MFERFTQQAREVVKAAVVSGEALGVDRIGAEHLLLGIVTTAVPSPAADVLREVGITRQGLESAIANGEQDARLLAELGIDMDEVKQRVERNFGEGSWARRSARKGHIPWSPDAKKALELSLRHALALKSKSIDAGHVLLGLLDSGTSVQETLHAVGVEPEEVKRQLRAVLKQAG